MLYACGHFVHTLSVSWDLSPFVIVSQATTILEVCLMRSKPRSDLLYEASRESNHWQKLQSQDSASDHRGIPMAERRRRRLLQRLLSGSKNIRFAEAVACAEAFGFRLSRIHGSHHIYVHTDIPEL